MEFKLNKIDIDVRQQISDATREGKVHSKKDLKINNDKKEQKKENEQDKKHDLKKYGKRKKLIVNAVKAETLQIECVKEAKENGKNSKGIFLDTKR